MIAADGYESQPLDTLGAVKTPKSGELEYDI